MLRAQRIQKKGSKNIVLRAPAGSLLRVYSWLDSEPYGVLQIDLDSVTHYITALAPW